MGTHLSQVRSKPGGDCWSLVSNSQLVHITQKTGEDKTFSKLMKFSKLFVSVERSPFPVVETSDDHGVPQRIHLAAAVVHHSGQPGVDGLRTVAVAVSEQLLIDANSRNNIYIQSDPESARGFSSYSWKLEIRSDRSDLNLQSHIKTVTVGLLSPEERLQDSIRGLMSQ